MNINSHSSKPSAWFKTKVFSFSSLCLCLFLLVGCGSSDEKEKPKPKQVDCNDTSTLLYTDICTADQFNAIRGNLSGEYTLFADINLSKYSTWTPIGENEYDAFEGKLDGNGYTLSGLKFQNADNNATYIGLFGYIDKAKIENLKVQVANSADTINLTLPSDQYFGIIAGYAIGANLTNIAVSSAAPLTIDKKSERGDLDVGGIVGELGGALIDKSTSSVTLKVTNDGVTSVGGIAGRNYSGGEIRNTYTTGNISAKGSKQTLAGGIAGYTVSGTKIGNTYASGDILANDTYDGGTAYAGGIAGNAETSTAISNSVALNPKITTITLLNSGTQYASRIAYGGGDNNFALSTIILTENGTTPTILKEGVNGYDGIAKNSDELGNKTTWSKDIAINGGGGLGWDFIYTWDWDSTTKRPVLQ